MPIAARPNMNYKRPLDVIGACALLVVMSPIMLLVAIAVKLTGRGPVLFEQARIGQHGRAFKMLKFRTMVPEAERLRANLCTPNAQLFKLRSDPRVTPVGRWLRRTSLDELPQLLNVLLGDMSLVGPRPPLPSEVVNYTRRQRQRLSVLPGLTGMWQVNGRSDLPLRRAIAMDLYYVKYRSFLLDTKILLQTVFAVITGKGAY
jgi:lipopolysaccharide/colanic/teichoic acid biosynthesis glycosyltransferase